MRHLISAYLIIILTLIAGCDKSTKSNLPSVDFTISLYPNPCKEYCTITSSYTSGNKYTLSLMDTNGVESLKIYHVALPYKLSVKALSGGTYILSLRAGSEVHTQKLSIVK